MFGSDVSENITLDMQVWVFLLLCYSCYRRLCTSYEGDSPGGWHGLAMLRTASLLMRQLLIVGLQQTAGVYHAHMHTDCMHCCWLQDVSPNAPPTVISMWLVIINPITKVALTLAPVAMAVEVRRQ